MRWTGIYHPAYKFTKEAFEEILNYPEAEIKFYVHLFHVKDMDKIVQLAESLGGKIIFKGYRDNPKAYHLSRFGIRIKPKFLVEIAKRPEVYVIGKLYKKGLWNNASRWVIQTNVSVDTSIWAHGIHGEGVIIGHNDNGLDVNHCFFNGTVDGQNKIVQLFDYDGGGFANGSHGTHTAGSACGGTDEQTTNLAYRGMAYKARLISQEPIAPDPPGFYQVLLDAYNLGARIHTNSWGWQCNAALYYCGANGYELEAIDIDQFVWDYPDMTVFVAAANGGDCGGFFTCGNGRRIACPATAKNDITIVATERAPNQEYKTTWSSFGAPINLGDERYGSNLAAPGENVNSADNGTACGITSMSGTSMATPTAVGAGALVIQYYKEGWWFNGTKDPTHSYNPSSALVKATMMASARDMQFDVDDDEGGHANSGVPNIYEGTGRITLEDALWFGESRRLIFDENQVSQGNTNVYNISVGSNASPFVVVLVWVDYLASANSYPVLVNNLDLEIQDPNGNLYRGNVTTNGWSTPNPSTPFDNLHNWEIAKFQAPASGTWTVRVIGTDIPQPKPGNVLPYAIVFVGENIVLGEEEFAEFLAYSTYSGIMLKWRKKYDAIEYRLMKSTSRTQGYKQIEKVSVSGRNEKIEYLDKEVENGITYYYKLEIYFKNGESFTLGPIQVIYRGVERKTVLYAPYPNPANKGISISFSLPERKKVTLEIVDKSGKNIKSIFRNKKMAKGFYSFYFNIKEINLPSSEYFLVLKGERSRQVKKFAVLK